MATPRLRPLPYDHSKELQPGFESARERMGFIPNSQLILQRRPHIIKAFRQLSLAVAGPESKLDAGLRALITLACTSVSREPYVWSHAAHSVVHTGQEAKLSAFNDYRTSPLFSDKERATIEYARAAAALPCQVTDSHLAELRQHWSEEEIVDITALIALYGFFDRYNGALATPLEPEVRPVAERYLTTEGWAPGRHTDG